MPKPTIALVTGGLSGEAKISYRSATTIFNHLSKEKYDVYLVDVRKDGWFGSVEGQEFPIDKNNFSISTPQGQIVFDMAMIGMHGTPGEDGRLQGYFDMIGMPYTGCNALSAAVTFNKRYAVAIAALSGIAVAKSMHFFQGEHIDMEEIASNLQFPVFIKPANGGSSIGMSKLPEAGGLREALDKAFAEDDQVLIEEFIEGREFTVGVCKLNGELTVLPFTEVTTDSYFFDFEAKYEGKSKEITPAEIDEAIHDEIAAVAKKIYHIFNCSGVIRIDFIYNPQKGVPYMLEVNTIPGQSDASVVPQQIRAMGLPLEALYESLVEDCLAKRKQ